MSKHPPKLAIDCDGVIADFSTAFRRHLMEVYDHLNLTRDPTSWSWTDLGVTPEMFSKAWRAWEQKVNVWTEVPPTGDAYTLAYAIQEGRLDEAEVWFLTSRGRSAGDSVLAQTKEWVFWNVGVDNANVIVVEHSSDKAAVVQALGMTHSIDDYPPTIIALNHQRHHDAYLMKRPWNEYERVAYDLPAVTDMAEFITIVRRGR
jgi:hypothetical protein